MKTTIRTATTTAIAVTGSLLLVVAAVAASSTVSGTVATATRGFGSVVVLTPATGGATAPDTAVVLDQVDKKFAPSVLVAQIGQTVTFKNSEEMLHNVHIYDLDTDETVLNAAQPVYGWTTDHVFEKAGSYVALCDVHPEMEAYIVVVDTPYHAVADATGTFSLDVPAGDYSLSIWNVDDDKRSSREVTVGASGLVIE